MLPWRDSASSSRSRLRRNESMLRNWWNIRTRGAVVSSCRTSRYTTFVSVPGVHVDFIFNLFRILFSINESRFYTLENHSNVDDFSVVLYLKFELIFQKPDRDEWGSGLEAMEAALQLEKTVNQSLLDLHKVADTHGDAQVCFCEGFEFLYQSVLNPGHFYLPPIPKMYPTFAPQLKFRYPPPPIPDEV